MRGEKSAPQIEQRCSLFLREFAGELGALWLDCTIRSTGSKSDDLPSISGSPLGISGESSTPGRAASVSSVGGERRGWSSRATMSLARLIVCSGDEAGPPSPLPERRRFWKP